MVASYSGRESSRLTRHCLKDASSLKAARFATQLQNPLREPELRRFMLRHIQKDKQGGEKRLLEFIETRLQRSLTKNEADSLVEWVANTAQLSDRQRLRFLTRIDSRLTYRYIRKIIQQTPQHEMVVVEELKRHPNPSLDLFLIEAYQAVTANVNSAGIAPVNTLRNNMDVSSDLIRAMVLCDTPRMRAFLEEKWSTSDHSKIALLEAIKQEASNQYPHLHDWTGLISEIVNVDIRLAAIPVLDRIDTPESSKVLADWARSSDIAVKDEAEWALAKYRERSRRAQALLVGSIKPDDLLVGHTAYVWDGKNYVPEATTSRSK